MTDSVSTDLAERKCFFQGLSMHKKRIDRQDIRSKVNSYGRDRADKRQHNYKIMVTASQTSGFLWSVTLMVILSPALKTGFLAGIP